MWNNFRDANEALRGLGLNYWVDCGTLLGLIREGDIIPHDLDVDFGIYGVEKQKELLNWMKILGFKLIRTYGEPTRGYEQTFRRGGRKVDFFYFYDSEDKLWSGSWWKKTHLIVSELDRDLILLTQQAKFKGETVSLPAKPEKLLEARYGNWRVVDKQWRWYRDPLCIRPSTLPPLKEMEEHENRE